MSLTHQPPSALHVCNVTLSRLVPLQHRPSTQLTDTPLITQGPKVLQLEPHPILGGS
jgi:hypothetical protein